MDARKLSKLIRLQRGPFRKSRITRCMGCELLAGDRHSVSDGKPRYYISVKGTEGGTVSGGGYYRPKEFIAIVATPDEGYRFEIWRSNTGFVSRTRRTTLYIQRDEEWLATFVPDV